MWLKLSEYEALKEMGQWNHEYFVEHPEYKVVYMLHGRLETAKVYEVHPTRILVRSPDTGGIGIIPRINCVPYSWARRLYNGEKQEELIVDSLVYEYL